LVVAILTASFHGPLAALLAAATSSISHSDSVVYFTPYDDRPLTPGDSGDIDINVNTRVPINAIGATIKFPTDTLEVVGISKKKSFLDLWTEETVINEKTGEIHFSGGTTASGGMSGLGTVLTLSVKAKKPGDAKIYFESAQVLKSDGNGSEADNEERSYTYHIATGSTEVASASGDVSISAVLPSPQTPSADLNSDGKIDIVDVSILLMKMLSPYDPRYDLDMNGSVSLSDLSVLFSKMASK
jgi:hypothetical protein